MSEDNKKIDLDAEYEDWTRVWSKTYQEYYWYNKVTQKSIWIHPSTLSSTVIDSNHKHANQDTTDSSKKHSIQSIDGQNRPSKRNRQDYSDISIRVAIIVPFRDIHVEQHRTIHLNRFIDSIPKFFQPPSAFPDSSKYLVDYIFRIYIIEQSNDNRKFNRGKLLNIGYRIAQNEGCNVFIFHDVDLLPSNELLQQYITLPKDNHPIHIARLWSRYNKNPKYFGGIVSFSKEMFEKINGFPNNFWGWGGEDDEMYLRVKEVGLEPVAPEEGSIIDMEEMTLEAKLDVLRSHRVWKCMNKNEVLKEHAATWKTNGLSTLIYDEVSRSELNEFTTKIIVDVKLNHHWTDDRCDIDDMQLPTSSLSSLASSK